MPENMIAQLFSVGAPSKFATKVRDIGKAFGDLGTSITSFVGKADADLGKLEKRLDSILEKSRQVNSAMGNAGFAGQGSTGSVTNAQGVTASSNGVAGGSANWSGAMGGSTFNAMAGQSIGLADYMAASGVSSGFDPWGGYGVGGAGADTGGGFNPFPGMTGAGGGGGMAGGTFTAAAGGNGEGGGTTGMSASDALEQATGGGATPGTVAGSVAATGFAAIANNAQGKAATGTTVDQLARYNQQFGTFKTQKQALAYAKSFSGWGGQGSPGANYQNLLESEQELGGAAGANVGSKQFTRELALSGAFAQVSQSLGTNISMNQAAGMQAYVTSAAGEKAVSQTLGGMAPKNMNLFSVAESLSQVLGNRAGNKDTKAGNWGMLTSKQISQQSGPGGALYNTLINGWGMSTEQAKTMEGYLEALDKSPAGKSGQLGTATTEAQIQQRLKNLGVSSQVPVVNMNASSQMAKDFSQTYQSAAATQAEINKKAADTMKIAATTFGKWVQTLVGGGMGALDTGIGGVAGKGLNDLLLMKMLRGGGGAGVGRGAATAASDATATGAEGADVIAAETAGEGGGAALLGGAGGMAGFAGLGPLALLAAGPSMYQAAVTGKPSDKSAGGIWSWLAGTKKGSLYSDLEKWNPLHKNSPDSITASAGKWSHTIAGGWNWLMGSKKGSLYSDLENWKRSLFGGGSAKTSAGTPTAASAGTGSDAEQAFNDFLQYERSPRSGGNFAPVTPAMVGGAGVSGAWGPQGNGAWGQQANAGANPNSGGSTVTGTTSQKTGSGSTVVRAAEGELGLPYVWGGGGPGGPSGSATAPPNQVGKAGFDCSGLSMYAMAKVGVRLPHFAASQAKMGTAVKGVENAQPGDLVFYAGSDGTAAEPGHVGIYVGNGRMVDAPYTGVDVRYDSVGSPVAIRRYVASNGQGAATAPNGSAGNVQGMGGYVGNTPGGVGGAALGEGSQGSEAGTLAGALMPTMMSGSAGYLGGLQGNTTGIGTGSGNTTNGAGPTYSGSGSSNLVLNAVKGVTNNLDVMAAMMLGSYVESVWNPKAVGAGSYGLWQIQLNEHPGVTAAQAENPQWAARYMLPSYKSAVASVARTEWEKEPEEAALRAVVDAERPGVMYNSGNVSTGWQRTNQALGKPKAYQLGSMYIESDQMAQLHAGEMVIPAPYAGAMRMNQMSGGGGGPQINVTFAQNSINYTAGSSAASSGVNNTKQDAEQLVEQIATKLQQKLDVIRVRSD